MSPLQLALAVVGGVLLAVVVLQGWWQSRRRAVRRAQAAGAEAPTDGAPGDGTPSPRVEPQLDMPPRTEPTLTRRVTARLDALIDAVATLAVEAPVLGDTALAHAPASRRAGSKPLHIEGLNAESGEWEAPVGGQRYREFQAGVQLANRAGALNEIEYSEFVQKVQTYADAIGAQPDFPDMLDAVARARELDQFAGEHDVQLALRLVSRGSAWSPGYLQQQAQQQGFVPGVLPGRLVMPAADDGAPPLLTLQFDPQAALAEDPGLAAVREITLAFDVPQTAGTEAPFEAWCAAGEALAGALDAALYDDGGQPLSPDAFPAIGVALEQLYATLAERDLAAGSAAARRLFS